MTNDQAFEANSTIDGRKAQLRSEMRALRKSLSPEDKARADASICDQTCALPAFRQAHTVFAYLSFGDEVETRGIINRAWGEGKDVVLPRCTAPRTMRWFRVENLDGLEKSSLGVEEPRIDPEIEVIPADCANAVALVPGLTFDDDGYRLGYGGGFYDAFLADFPGTSIGLCRKAQRTTDLVGQGVIDSCDKPVDQVITA